MLCWELENEYEWDALSADPNVVEFVTDLVLARSYAPDYVNLIYAFELRYAYGFYLK